MESLKSNRWLMIAIPMVSGFFLCNQPANAQFYNPNSVYGSASQQMAQGLLTPGQAQDMMNRQNNYAKRAARLLQNDGGVLTPNDANKLAQEAARDAATDNSYVNGNVGINGGLGTGTGLSGLLGNLLGTSSPLSGSLGYNSYPYDPTNPYLNGYGAYTGGLYNSPYTGGMYNSGYSPYSGGGIYNAAMYNTPYAGGGSCSPGAWGRQNAWLQHQRHEQWQHMHGGGGGWGHHSDPDGDGD